MIEWAHVARTLFEETMGRVTPDDLGKMSRDQVLIMWLARDELGLRSRKVSPEQAQAMGLIDTSGKSAVQLAWEQLAKDKAGNSREARRRKREQRLQAQQAAKPEGA